MDDHTRIVHMCRFFHNGEEKMGEYSRREDGSGICTVMKLDGTVETITVSHPDGGVPCDISDLESLNVPVHLAFDGGRLTAADRSAAVWRTSYTGLILAEYEVGALDADEAGSALWEHLFGQGHTEDDDDEIEMA